MIRLKQLLEQVAADAAGEAALDASNDLSNNPDIRKQIKKRSLTQRIKGSITTVLNKLVKRPNKIETLSDDEHEIKYKVRSKDLVSLYDTTEYIVNDYLLEIIVATDTMPGNTVFKRITHIVEIGPYMYFVMYYYTNNIVTDKYGFISDMSGTTSEVDTFKGQNGTLQFPQGMINIIRTKFNDKLVLQDLKKSTGISITLDTNSDQNKERTDFL